MEPTRSGPSNAHPSASPDPGFLVAGTSAPKPPKPNPKRKKAGAVVADKGVVGAVGPWRPPRSTVEKAVDEPRRQVRRGAGKKARASESESE